MRSNAVRGPVPFYVLFILLIISIFMFWVCFFNPSRLMQYRFTSAYNPPFFTTNSGALVWNNLALTVESRGIHSLIGYWELNVFMFIYFFYKVFYMYFFPSPFNVWLFGCFLFIGIQIWKQRDGVFIFYYGFHEGYRSDSLRNVSSSSVLMFLIRFLIIQCFFFFCWFPCKKRNVDIKVLTVLELKLQQKES